MMVACGDVSFEVFVERLKLGGLRRFGECLESSDGLECWKSVLLFYFGLDMVVSAEQHPCVSLVLKATPGNYLFSLALFESV